MSEIAEGVRVVVEIGPDTIVKCVEAFATRNDSIQGPEPGYITEIKQAVDTALSEIQNAVLSSALAGVKNGNKGI